jgi:hypothetical protein
MIKVIRKEERLNIEQLDEVWRGGLKKGQYSYVTEMKIYNETVSILKLPWSAGDSIFGGPALPQL